MGKRQVCVGHFATRGRQGTHDALSVIRRGSGLLDGKGDLDLGAQLEFAGGDAATAVGALGQRGHGDWDAADDLTERGDLARLDARRCALAAPAGASCR